MSILSPTSSARPPSRKGSSDYDHQITLVDHTKPASDTEDNQDGTDTEDEPRALRKTASTGLSLKLTRESLREELARRKYAKWQERKPAKVPEDSIEQDTTAITGEPTAAASGDPAAASEDQSESSESRIARGKERIKDLLRGSKTFKIASDETDSVVDILYENQRGYFLFGVPLFSQNSLLNFDPSPWMTGDFKPSAVDITNAQVPDPSWEWAWRSWYVDMSYDVDEEGWQYSFSFGKSFAWHGTHPWFHAFVRRRRWLRKRTRIHQGGVRGSKGNQKEWAQSHHLNADYFTIHSARKGSSTQNADRSVGGTDSVGRSRQHDEDQEPIEEVRTIAVLMRRLKKATIDRERIVVIRQFLHYGDEELHYLPDYMHSIMSLFIFQNSRRQLLALLIRESEVASQYREEQSRQGKDVDPDEEKHIDYLNKAVEAAEEQVKKLEFWSDIRDVSRDGELFELAESWGEWDHSRDAHHPSEKLEVEKEPRDQGHDLDHEDRESKISVRDQYPGDQERPFFSDDTDDDQPSEQQREPNGENHSTDDRQGRLDKGKEKATTG